MNPSTPSLASLKKSRSNRKGNITKAVHILDHHKAMLLKNVTFKDLTKLRKSAEDAISSCEEVEVEEFRQEYTELELNASDIDDPLLNRVRSDIQTRYAPIQQKVLDQARLDAAYDSTPSSRVGSSLPAPTPPRKSRLRELSLPTFHGDLSEWRSF